MMRILLKRMESNLAGEIIMNSVILIELHQILLWYPHHTRRCSTQRVGYILQLLISHQESENVHDLKNEMSQMRRGISDSRKLVQSCMEWQAKLQGSTKDEISSAIRQSQFWWRIHQRVPQGHRSERHLLHLQ